MLRDENILDLESRKCFNFFWNETTTDKNKRGFGLIRDRYPNGHGVASIASVGFGLTAIIIGAERGWISYEDGRERVEGTLNTLLYNMENIKGFFYHFVSMDTGERAYGSEVSIIDTAIAACGAITAGEYFGGKVKEMAEELYKRIDWEWYRDPVRNQFYMGYSPKKGFSGWWDFYAEQLMLYFLAAGSPTHPVDGSIFYAFERKEHTMSDGKTFINSWFGSLFTHQFSHAWFDLRDRVDSTGIDWWSNSLTATLINRQFCIENSARYRTFGYNSWGLTPCDSPRGYNGRFGCAPSARFNDEHYADGTIPPCGAAGSIVFTPELSAAALKHYYSDYPKLWGKYGFKDAFNLCTSEEWYGEDVIGIDKGITLLMIENYRTGLIWNIFMRNGYVQAGLDRTGLLKRNIEDAS